MHIVASHPVLVAGGAGYVGSHVVLALVAAGFPVVVLDNLSNGSRWSVSAEAIFHEGDIGDAGLVARILETHGIRSIIHCAGSICVPESVAHPHIYYQNNVAASCTLIRAAVQNRIEHFVFSSSAAVYGLPDSDMVPETAPVRPVNPYGRSKMMTEMMLEDAARSGPFDYCALRYFNVAGADPFGRTGQCGEVSTHLVKIMAEVATAKRSHVPVYGDDYATPDGTAIRDYVHVGDLADAHVAALLRLIGGRGSLVLNCGYGRGHSVREVLETGNRIAGRSLATRPAPRRAGDPDRLVADNRRILGELDWKPRFDALDLIVWHAFSWERKLPGTPAPALALSA
jgi:UDP-glucose 4-epimerase